MKYLPLVILPFLPLGCSGTPSPMQAVITAETTPDPTTGKTPAQVAVEAVKAAEANPKDPMVWLALATATVGAVTAGYVALKKSPPSQGK